MKKLLISGLLVFSMNSLCATEANKIINKYMNKNNSTQYNDDKQNQELTELINSNLIEWLNNRLRTAIKAVCMAKKDKMYDINWYSYIKAYFVDTQDGRTLREISQVEKQLRNQLAILHNNTWEQWGWSAAKYSTVILATASLTVLAMQNYPNILDTTEFFVAS